MKMKLLFLFVALTLSINCFAQFSKTHYIPPISNSASQDPQGQFIYISCPSITPISFVIKEIGGVNINGTVSRDTPYVYTIGSGYDTQLLIDSGDVGIIKNNKGYIVEAQDLIYVTVRLTATPGHFHAAGLVSKGIAALGTSFRIGAFLNVDPPNVTENHYTFATILATENNTVISFSDIKPGAELLNNAAAGNSPANIILNAGESYAIAVQGTVDANRDALIGALITSDKPIAVNCGSFAGSNSNSSNLDLGIDQIVSAERTGKEYIFIKGNGFDITERPFIIAHEDNTEIFLNNNVSTTPDAILNHGEYFALDGTAFSANGNLYIRTSKNVFAYQAIGSVGVNGQPNLANQNMYFLPPLSCQTPSTINNIPLINEVGSLTDFTGTVCVVTKTGATLDFIINGINYPLALLPAGIIVNGPFNVIGNTNYVTYTFEGLTGNISVFSSEQVYVSYFGSSGAATYGGFYSGFTFKPEIVFQSINAGQSSCIPNVELKVSTLSGFDTFQWYFNNTVIGGATNFNYFPTQPGYYKVRATLTECGLDYFSDEIPVSNCPLDSDNDTVNNNIDLDIDNDGIANCTESYGNQNINISNTSAGTVTVGSFSNAFTGIITTSATASATPFVGSADGSFISEVAAGKTNWVNYELTFAQPINVGIEYITTANPTDLLNSQAEYVINSELNKTITVLNPNNQLLIDTNYDGFYEDGITQFSSFEIRFRLNNATALPAGTGTFKFLTNQSDKISFKHKNLSDALPNRVSLKFFASCVPKDSDNDSVFDESDLDSDNDGILDTIEAQGNNVITISNTDANGDGMDDAFGTGIVVVDSDTDGYPDYLDSDSDNDGIYDVVEAGHNAPDTDFNGVIDGGNFGLNGLNNNLETVPDNGILNYNIANTDTDGTNNYLDLDSDADGCNDVIEAGFTDTNSDGLLGNTTPPSVNSSGSVTSGVGYTTPNINYITSAPISITTQPQDQITCELQGATFTIVTNPVNGYQWQVSTDGGTVWNNLTNNATYSGVTTISLAISSVVPAMSGYKYRVFLSKNGNSCGLFSAAATLTTYALPVVTTPVNLIQCDDDLDGTAAVNLTVKNSFISANYLNETFTYYTSFAGATNEDTTVQITNPIAYSTNSTTVYVRVENANGCFVVAQLNVVVSVTQIPSGTLYSFYTCDDYIDAVNNDYDGISLFPDFSSVTPAIQALLPATAIYTIKYYRNEADALAEINELTNLTNYRNIGYPNVHNIWVRVDSNIDNACYGLGPYVRLTVEKTPIAYPLNGTNTIRKCDDDQDDSVGFNTSAIQSTILNGQTNMTVTYTDNLGNALPSPLPNPFTVTNQISITARVTNNTTQAANGPCYDEMTFQLVVDDLPEAFPVTVGSLTVCDGDGTDTNNQDGLFAFDTSTIQSQILNGQSGVSVTYTLSNGTVLNQLSNPFITGTQNVIATVINPTNTSCTATTILNFIVNPLPKIQLIDDAVICINLPSRIVTINAGLTDGTSPTNYTYQWYLGGVLLPSATSYSITNITAPGIYTVEVTSQQGCTQTRTVTVIESNAATIQQINISDLTDNNTVEIIVSGTSIGNYVYSLDNGVYQFSNVFTNVTMGFHTVTVLDLNECGLVSKPISVMGIPHYFTPNGDGTNDTWNIKGFSTLFNPKATIRVFDRYGKLMKQFTPESQGWDGMYNGQQAIADDYWYLIELKDGRSVKGHFALKR